MLWLSVKPNMVTKVLGEIKHLITPDHVIVSICAGVTLATIEGCLPPGLYFTLHITFVAPGIYALFGSQGPVASE
jgi:pyrroline-5-carboxylate reductase